MLQDALGALNDFASLITASLSDLPSENLGLVLLLVTAFLGLLALEEIRLRSSQAEVEKLQGELEEIKTLLGKMSLSAEEAKRDSTEGAKREESRPVTSEIEPSKPVVAPIEVEETAISKGLKKSRAGLLGRLAGLFSTKNVIDTKTLDDLEEVLILSDVGARCAGELVEQVKITAEASPAGVSAAELKALLMAGIRSRLVNVDCHHEIYEPKKSPLIVLVVGVNGVGKTTTVAKLATKYMAQGKKVLAVAADTFRAAAVEQLAEWSSRVGFTLVKGAENAKPSAVVFDGMVAAKDGNFDVVLIDTAGRLHTKSNLMQELEGVRNSIRKHFPDGPHETILVLDGVSGQNALVQAREFNEAVALTGIVVTKLDGTPKGGIIVAISQELKIPVFFVGVGEKTEDLLVFEPDAFVNALFEEGASSACSAPGDVVRASNA
jgi:fused signal recognition particle receptor